MAQMQQMLQQAGQELQQLHGQLQQVQQEAQSGMQREILKAQTTHAVEQARQETARYIAELNADNRHDIAELAGVVQLLAKQIQPPQTLAADVQADLAEDLSEDRSEEH